MEDREFAATVATNVEKAISSAGRSRRSVAQSAGISRSTLDRRLDSEGRSPFSVLEISGIASTLGLRPESLIATSDGPIGTSALAGATERVAS